MKRGSIIILFLVTLLISGCTSRFVTKECLYREGVGTTKSMGVFCNDKGLDDCIKLKDNLEQFKSIETENLLCSTTTLKKIVNSNGGFVNCNSADDCYRVLAITKPFDEFNVVVCDSEFCKTTVNYDSQLGIKQPEPEKINLEIPTEETTPTETSTTTVTQPVIVTTGCGDKICAEDENCANCESDCGCRSPAYCNTTTQKCISTTGNSLIGALLNKSG
ncbi:MAG: hypothetical protein PHF86_08260 [Candidatus Nanoarchaeia archaeon]|nr:hypothetical protein [Candidatus Nanoarchaeia archaeon]